MARLARQCDATPPVVGSRSARPRAGAADAGWDAPADSPSYRDRCTIVAALRAGFGHHGTLTKEWRAPIEWDRDALPGDWPRAREQLRLLCPEPDGHPACELRSWLEATEAGTTIPTSRRARAMAAAELLARSEAPARPGDTEPATLLDRAAALTAPPGSGATQMPERSSASIPEILSGSEAAAEARLVSLRERIEAARTSLRMSAYEGLFADFEPAVRDATLDPTAPATRAALFEIVGRDARPVMSRGAEERARIEAFVRRAGAAVLRRAASERSYFRAQDGLDVLAELCQCAALQEPKRTLAAEAATHHRAESERLMAEGLLASAWLHASFATSFDDALHPPGLSEALAQAAPLPQMRARLTTAACPWAAVPPLLGPGTGPTVDVELAWRTCESAERTWQSAEEVVYTEEIEEVRKVRRTRRLEPGETCVALSQDCTLTTVTTLVEEKVKVPVERRWNETVRHRQLVTRAFASATLRLSTPINLTFDKSAELEEVERKLGRPQSRFSAASLEGQREPIRAALAAFLGPGGELERALRGAYSRAETDRALAMTGASAASVHDALAAAAYLGRHKTDPRALASLAERHEIAPARLLDVLGR